MKNLFQDHTNRQVTDDLSVAVDFRIEKSDSEEKYSFLIYPSTNDKTAGFGLYPSKVNAEEWAKMREVSPILEKLCRFQQAVVTNRMAEVIPVQLNLRPISELDFLLPIRSFKVNAETFLKTIGYGVLEIDLNIRTDEDLEIILREFINFTDGFHEEFEGIWKLKQDTETSRLLKKQIDKLDSVISKQVFFGINSAELELVNADLEKRIKKLNVEIRRITDNLSYILTDRQDQLIKFWLEKADEYFDKDFRKWLR